MALTASRTDRLAKLVQPDKIAAAGFQAPEWVEVRAGTDHAGADVYYVLLIFPDNTPSKTLDWSQVKPMVEWVHDRIWEADGTKRWPYVQALRESEALTWR